MKLIKYILIGLLIVTSLQALAKQPESHYQNIFCDEMGGVTEYRLPDKTRVDCLTEKYAIEVDFQHKWAESLGQSLHYAHMTGKKPGILLIKTNDRFPIYKQRIEEINKRYNLGITIFVFDK